MAKFRVRDKVICNKRNSIGCENRIEKGCEYTVIRINGIYCDVVDEEGNMLTGWNMSHYDLVKESSISLKLEGIEEGEKFNLLDSNGKIHFSSLYYIKDNALIDKNSRYCDSALLYILVGHFTIQKIEPKQEKIERIEQEMRKLADQLKELKNG